jgi:hypothetical protein
MTLVATIALGVAAGILLAGGLLYACQRWGQDAVRLAYRTGLWVWTHKRNLALGVLLLALMAGVGALALEEHERQRRVEANKRYWESKKLVPDPYYQGR